MKKQVLVINIHSFVDVITNSSTELFVCDTEKSIKQVEDMLKELLSKYNKKEGTDYSFEQTFETPYIYTKEMFDKVESKYSWEYENSKNVGKLIICGTNDNSIPYDIWEDINDMFEAINYHLG